MLYATSCYDRIYHEFTFGSISYWRHQMVTFSALLALCAVNSPVTGEPPPPPPPPPPPTHTKARDAEQFLWCSIYNLTDISIFFDKRKPTISGNKPEHQYLYSVNTFELFTVFKHLYKDYKRLLLSCTIMVFIALFCNLFNSIMQFIK